MRIERIYKSNPLVFSKKKTQQAIYIYIYITSLHTSKKKNIKGKAARKKNWKKTTRKEGEERR